MLSHVRLQQESVVDMDSHPLSSLFKLFGAGVQKDPRKVRRDQRLQGKPNPFINFRSASSDSQELDLAAAVAEEEEKVIVTKWFTGQVAKLLLADGSECNADVYRASDSGFIEAVWFNPVAVLVLELPNSRLNGSGQLIPSPAPAPGPKPKWGKDKLKGKPAAKRRRLRSKTGGTALAPVADAEGHAAGGAPEGAGGAPEGAGGTPEGADAGGDKVTQTKIQKQIP